MKIRFLIRLLALFAVYNLCYVTGHARASTTEELKPGPGEAVATFAGGCFWCTEADFEKVPGVIRVISGFSGGKEVNPTYKDVSAGKTSHLESVQLFFNPARVSYKYLLEYFWRHIDPTDPDGQFVDRGNQYRSAIFTHDEEQRLVAEESRKRLADSGVFKDKPIVTEIRPYEVFYPAGKYHQQYSKKNPLRYRYYRFGSGRDQFLKRVWADENAVSRSEPENKPKPFVKPGPEELQKSLTPMQFYVTQRDGTESPYKNEYWDNKKQGIYVDIVSGEPLFSSLDKYDSRTGWPSFTKPLEPDNVVERQEKTLFSNRIEVRSKLADSHLGHVFMDGPPPARLRYCINSAALRFIPWKYLEKEGYGKYAAFFKRLGTFLTY